MPTETTVEQTRKMMSEILLILLGDSGDNGDSIYSKAIVVSIRQIRINASELIAHDILSPVSPLSPVKTIISQKFWLEC